MRKKWTVIFVGFMALFLCLVVLAYVTDTTDRSCKPAIGGRCVTLKVYGEAKVFDVAFLDTMSHYHSRLRISPWQETVFFKHGDTANIQGERLTLSGRIVCEIWIDGALVQQVETIDDDRKAVCKAIVP